MILAIIIIGVLLMPQGANAEIVISEVYPAPSEGYEWVELCNNSESSISLSGYNLQDSVGKKLYVPNITLEPDQYVLATASSILNNGGDTVSLLKNSFVIQKMSYDVSIGAQESFVFCAGAWGRTNNVTPAYENDQCVVVSPTITSSPTQKIKPTTGTAIENVTLAPSIAPVKRKPTPINFAQVHGVRTTKQDQHIDQPTPEPTFEPILVSPPHREGLYALSSALAGLAFILTLYTGYRIAKKVKDQYNKSVDDP